jgi:hypothetical protein
MEGLMAQECKQLKIFAGGQAGRQTRRALSLVAGGERRELVSILESKRKRRT